jgi:hypothetical protein
MMTTNNTAHTTGTTVVPCSVPPEQHHFHELVQEFSLCAAAQGMVSLGEMLGHPALVYGDKAFAVFDGAHLALKLNEEQYRAAMALPNSTLWDPSGRHRPMTNWVRIAPSERPYWSGLVHAALKFAKSSAAAAPPVKKGKDL